MNRNTDMNNLSHRDNNTPRASSQPIDSTSLHHQLVPAAVESSYPKLKQHLRNAALGIEQSRPSTLWMQITEWEGCNRQ